jgi:hypothetical protein
VWRQAENPRYVMGQIGHADAAFTLRVYAKVMDRRDGEPERLRALVKGDTLEAEALGTPAVAPLR